MKLYGFCSLLLCQIASIFGASEKSALGLVAERNGYVEFQSTISAERNDSVVLDVSFEPKDYILDWADLGDEISQTVRAIALVCMRTDVKQEKKETEAQLKPFFEDAAVISLRQLKQVLKEGSQFKPLSFEDTFGEKHRELLSFIQSLALRLECIGLKGSAQVTYESAKGTPEGNCVSQDWFSSLNLANSKPYLMGSIDREIAQSGTAFQQTLVPDLHMLIFHRKPALVYQGE